MWFNIAAANGHKIAARNRDDVRKEMTAQDVSQAQALARECIQKNTKRVEIYCNKKFALGD